MSKSVQDFFRLIDQASLKIITVDSQFRITYANQSFSRGNLSEVLGKPATDYVAPSYREGLGSVLKEVFEKGTPMAYEISEDRPGQEKTWHRLQLSPVIEGDHVTAVMMSSTDITDRVKMELALKEEESKYRAITEQSLLGIAILPQGPVNVAFVNPQLSRMLGCSQEEILEMDTGEIVQLVHENDREEVLEFLRAAMAETQDSSTMQLRLIRSDGSEIWVELTAGKIVYENKPAVEVSLLDITDRRRSQRELIESEGRFRTLLQSMNDLVIVHDKEDRYHSAFTGNQAILYTTPENYLGRHISEVLPEHIAGEYLAKVRKVRETGATEDFDYSLQVDVETKWFSASISPHEDGESTVVVVRDVTERHHANEALKRERAVFKNIAEAALHAKDAKELAGSILEGLLEPLGFEFGIFRLFDEKRNVLRPSAKAGRTAGLVLEDLSCSEELGKEYLMVKSALERKPQLVSDIPMEPDGRTYLNRLINLGAKAAVSLPILDEKGQLLGVASFATRENREYTDDDRELFSTISGMLATVLERKLAEAALLMSERRYRELLTDMSEGIGIADLEERIVFANQSFADMLGFRSPQKLVGMSLLDLVHPTEMEKLLLQTQEREAGISSRYIIRMISTDGQDRHIRVSAVPSRDDEGQVEGTVAIMTDVTEQLRAEEALRDSEARFRSVFESTPVAMHLLELAEDGQLILVDANPAAAELVGSYHDRIVGKAIEDIVWPTPSLLPKHRVLEEYHQIMETGKPWYTEEIMRSDEKIVSALQVHAFQTSPRTMVASFLDITERAIAEDEVKELNAELSRRVEERTAELAAANKELESFAYTVSHDLRAPLRTMDGFSQALTEDYPEQLDDTGKDYLRRIRAAATRMGGLIEDILQLSRVTRADMDRTSVDLSLVATEVIHDLESGSPDRNINVRIAETPSARCDRRLLKLALRNLLENAWKFTRDIENATIEFGSEVHDDKTVFYVRDNGAGFDMRYHEKLFKPFQRLHSEEEFEGSGIGLATVQRIISRHGGNLWAEGAINEGSTFYFTLSS